MAIKIVNNIINGIKWIVFGFFGLIWKLLKDIYRKKLRIVFAIGLAVGAYYLWGLSSSLLWGLFLIFLFCAWDSRFIAFLALICLTTCPILLQVKQDKIAEEVAVYAYFFLVMTVVLQMFEYWRDERAEKKKKKELETKGKSEPLLLSEKIRLVMGDYESFVKDVKSSSLNVGDEIKEKSYEFNDKNDDGIIDKGELTEGVQMSLLGGDAEKNDALMKLDIYEDYELVKIEKKKMEVVSSDKGGE
ncbi:MAG: hypothetical protein PHW52_02670 [Candidatus Pacebacteria bacterium]|nr:hypothetical protein [Candidatus Paceibacterota bacterium]